MAVAAEEVVVKVAVVTNWNYYLFIYLIEKMDGLDIIEFVHFS